jgi:hypothetical protein
VTIYGWFSTFLRGVMRGKTLSTRQQGLKRSFPNAISTEKMSQRNLRE